MTNLTKPSPQLFVSIALLRMVILLLCAGIKLVLEEIVTIRSINSNALL